MADTTLLTATAAGGMATLSLGTVAGVPIDTLVFGLMGGVVAVLCWPARGVRALPGMPMPPQGLGLYLALAATVLASVFVAAAMAPLTAAYLHLERVPVHYEVRAFSFVWGAGAQVLLVAAIEALRRRVVQLGGKAQTNGRTRR